MFVSISQELVKSPLLWALAWERGAKASPVLSHQGPKREAMDLKVVEILIGISFIDKMTRIPLTLLLLLLVTFSFAQSAEEQIVWQKAGQLPAVSGKANPGVAGAFV